MEEHKKIIVLGHAADGHVGRHVVDLLKENSHEIILVDDLSKLKSSEDALKDQNLENIGSVYREGLKNIDLQGYDFSQNNYTRKIDPKIDIRKEYLLIKEKKSKLSKWERDEIVKTIESKTDGKYGK